MSEEMRRSWLVQRLNQPNRGTGLLGADNPFSFGGGLRNGGLSDDAMVLLRGIFSFDYMGAAEFEFGAVPEALNALAKDSKHLVARTVTIDLSTLAANWRDKTVHQGERDVYIIARADHADEVERRVVEWAQQGYAVEMKEPARLDAALRPNREEWDRTDGWLELSNGFFAFTDRAMFEATAALFGVKVEQVPA
jgi:hypothetical protein